MCLAISLGSLRSDWHLNTHARARAHVGTNNLVFEGDFLARLFKLFYSDLDNQIIYLKNTKSSCKFVGTSWILSMFVGVVVVVPRC